MPIFPGGCFGCGCECSSAPCFATVEARALPLCMPTATVCPMIELFEHNKTAYAAALALLDETNRACVIHPTGTGKSFIAFKWVEDNPDGRFVWLSPSENIFDTQLANVKRVSGFEPGNVTFLTYARLMVMSEEEIKALAPTHAVLDEFHRAGAERWEGNVRRLLEAFPDMRVLGLSATPIRYLDNQRDMAEALFDNCIADSMNLGEAIARGILPAPKYVVSLYTFDREAGGYDDAFRTYRNRIRRGSAAVRAQAEDVLEKLRRALEKSKGLDKVFSRHLKRGKYLAFCANVAHMGEMVEKVPAWFGGVDAEPKVYTVWADSPTARRDYQAFMADDSDHLRLMFCVDMFNEGIHVADVDGVILFRPTISPIIYKQQIGRALSAMKGGVPLIIDAVNNFENLFSISSVQAEMTEIINFYRNNRREDEIVVDSFEIVDEVRECRELINRLEETLSLSWESMYDCAKAYYKAHGDLEMSSRYRTEDGIPLGNWIFTQRAVYNGDSTGILNEGRIELLNAIGMNWDYARDAAWEKGLSHAMAYRAAWGNLNAPNRYACQDGYPLGSWLMTQRAAYMKLRNSGADPMTNPRFRQLQQLGMSWNRADSAFEEGMLHATRYAAEQGHLNVPAKYICADGFKLGAWIERMRRRRAGYGSNAPLDADQIARLEAIGMQWEGSQQRQWNERFREAERYYRAHGDLQVPKRYEQNGVKLWVWLNSQQRKAKEGKLDAEQMQRLKAIGFFDSASRNKSWEENYLAAKRYYEAVGNVEIPHDYVSGDGVWLGRWVDEQRRSMRRGALTAEQIKRLDAIGMRWDDPRKTRWYVCLEAVRGYPRNTAGVPVVPAGVLSEFGTGLKAWVQHQDDNYRKGRLDSTQRMRWEEMIHEAVSSPVRHEAARRRPAAAAATL